MIPTHRLIATALATCLAGSAQAAGADIDQVRATTAKLINLLVEQGVLTRARAEALMKDIDAPAAPAEPGKATAAPGGKESATVRVPYVPRFVRDEIKEELRTELAAQAFREGWAGPGAVPGWVRGLEWEGDLRARFQFDNFDPANSLNAVSVTDTNRSRATSFVNTTQDRTRLRVRGRIGLTAHIDDNWSAGVRLTTGSTTDPVSSNQTLGTYGNRFTAAFDRAYIRYRYQDQFNAVFGRFGNPWFGTDLVWANDLGFDGVAVQWTPKFGSVRPFVTVAAMPVQEVELSLHDKWLLGAQAGADFGLGGVVRGKVGLGLYAYRNVVGVPNAAGSGLNDFTAPAFAQKGNTYFNISSDATRPLLALAADYRIVNLTGMLDIESVFGKHVIVTGDFARNLGFNEEAVSARAGQTVKPEINAYSLRVTFGDPEVRQRGEWQGFFAYKRVERDAVLDAFNDSDFHLGGTDAKGYVLGGSYGLGKNTAATVRWISADAISGPPFAIDTLQVDLSVRF